MQKCSDPKHTTRKHIRLKGSQWVKIALKVSNQKKKTRAKRATFLTSIFRPKILEWIKKNNSTNKIISDVFLTRFPREFQKLDTF